MRGFISHSSKDRQATEALAQALSDRGFMPWCDGWEIGSGDDIVARINAGLEPPDEELLTRLRGLLDDDS